MPDDVTPQPIFVIHRVNQLPPEVQAAIDRAKAEEANASAPASSTPSGEQ